VSNVIDLDDHRTTTTTLDVAGVRSVVVHSARGELGLRLALKNAVRSSALLVADQLLVLSTDLSRDQVRGLPARARRRLALEVARENGWDREWQALYGSYLTVDERLVATAVWGHRRHWRELRGRLRAAHQRRLTLQRTVPSGLAIPDTVSVSLRTALGVNDVFRKVSDSLAGIHALAGLNDSVRQTALGLAPVRLPGIGQMTQMPKLGLAGTGLDTLRRIGARHMALGNQHASITGLGVLGPTPLLPDAVGRALGVHKALAGSLVHPNLAKQLQTTLGIGPLQVRVERALAPYRDIARVGQTLSPLTGIGEELAALGCFLDTWGDDPLWFLLAPMGTRGTWKLVTLDREQVHVALLQALEDVVLDGEYVGMLRQAVAEADDLTEAEQDHLDHALGHAQQGEWRHALSSFHRGFEGALYQVGLRRQLVTPNDRRTDTAEKLLKVVIGRTEYVVFVIKHVLGGAGNAHRHGRTSTGDREVMLAGIVALAGWIDHFMNLPAMEVLVGFIEDHLPAAVDAVTGPGQLEAAG
jgi:hypothetical protein